MNEKMNKRRQPRFSVPTLGEMDTFSVEDIAQMDKEVEEILSSSDDEENDVDDFLDAPNDESNSSSGMLRKKSSYFYKCQTVRLHNL